MRVCTAGHAGRRAGVIPARKRRPGTGRHALVWVAAWQALSALGEDARPQPPGAAAFEPAVIAITVNGTARGDFFVHRTQAGQIALRRQDLAAAGLSLAPPTAAVIDGIEHVALDGIAGVDLRMDEPGQTLTITAEPQLLSRHVAVAPQPPLRARRVAGEGVFLNWAIEQVLGDSLSPARTALALEAGAHLGPSLLLHRSQSVTDAQGHRRLARLATTWNLDLPERLLRWTAGDLATGSDDLDQGVLLGGLSVATLARLDPYRVRYPLGVIQGQAFLPSEVEVYVDGQRVRTERVPAGVFEIRDLATPLGARPVQVLVRDPYGRVQRFDESIYATPRLLAPGLHDFQYALGGLRQDTGTGSPRYGPTALSARHAWGASAGLTLGLRAQAREGLVSAGSSMVLQVADKGLLSAHVASSRASGLRGHAVLVRHDYQSARWGIGLGARADSPSYAALGQTQVLGGLRREVQAHASRALGEGSFVWVSHSQRDLHPAARISAPSGWQVAQGLPRRTTAIGYTALMRPWGASLRLAASRSTQAANTWHEWSASLVFLLDRGGLASLQTRHGPDGLLQSLQWSRPVPFEGGWGHDLSASRQTDSVGESLQWRMASQLEADTARLRADWSGGSGPSSGTLRLSAAGALSYLGGQWHISRPIDDSFALVQVDGLAGVPVKVNGLPAGVTDARGQRLVTRVGAHNETLFEIDPDAIPIDRRIAQLQQLAVLPERGAAVIRFEARALRAVTAQVVAPSGKGYLPLPLTRIRIGSGAQAMEAMTGLRGEVYLEDLAPGSHEGQARGHAGPCHFHFQVPHTREVLTDLGALECTPAAQPQNRSDGPR
ncbi:MAG: hypothetical protein RL513_1372 [Pseudomonadota bacterium]